MRCQLYHSFVRDCIRILHVLHNITYNCCQSVVLSSNPDGYKLCFATFPSFIEYLIAFLQHYIQSRSILFWLLFVMFRHVSLQSYKAAALSVLLSRWVTTISKLLAVYILTIVISVHFIGLYQAFRNIEGL